ncbi:MAG: ABC transporter permease [Thermodesulfobacteriota bacterium]|jgi:lipopolysaccharide transport system permease protein
MSIKEQNSTKSFPESQPSIIIRPRKGLVPLELRELWEYRDLLYLFVWRDIKVRYKQTLVGTSWAIIQPFIAMIVLSLFFGKLAKMPSEGTPYPIFAYSALVPWTYLVNVLSQSSNSVVSNRAVVTRVYFPRLIIPMTTVMTGLMDFCIAFAMLLVMMLFYGIWPTAAIFTLPFFLLLGIVTALGLGLWLAALNVKYRDIGFTLPFLTQIGFFVTPIAYPSSLVPERWQAIYGLNPMAGVVEGFRWALLGKTEPPGMIFAVSVLVAVCLLIGGLYFFRHKEDTFADVV